MVAMSILQGREYAVRSCVDSAGIGVAYTPEVPFLEGEPGPGYGLASSWASAADRSVDASTGSAHEANHAAVDAIDRGDRAEWDACHDEWLGEDRRTEDLRLSEQLYNVIGSAHAATLDDSSVQAAFERWSECLVDSAGVRAAHPGEVRTLVEEEWTALLAENDLEAQRTMSDRIAEFGEYERFIASAEARCYSEHVRTTFDSVFMAALARRESQEDRLLTMIEQTRPPYSYWSATEAELLERMQGSDGSLAR
ncbi:MAG: hypothetical protein JJE52_09050 [Acidimicrobiia bacterium]|nr:hypothetical protein [Acidimicrobiia bacterium]